MKDMKEMMQMLSDEPKPEMTDARKQAKMEVLRELMEMAMSQEGDELMEGLQGMNKVTVAAKDEEGLMEGLDKAEEVVEEMPEDMMATDEEETEEEEM